MTPEELADIVGELNAKSAIITEVVKLLNLTGEYMNAEPKSPMEDQAEAALNDRVKHLVEDHVELVGHILIAMSVMLVEVPEWTAVQAWLSGAEEDIHRKAREIGYDPH